MFMNSLKRALTDQGSVIPRYSEEHNCLSPVKKEHERERFKDSEKEGEIRSKKEVKVKLPRTQQGI